MVYLRRLQTIKPGAATLTVAIPADFVNSEKFDPDGYAVISKLENGAGVSVRPAKISTPH